LVLKVEKKTTQAAELVKKIVELVVSPLPPGKIKLEPKNHPIEGKSFEPNLHDFRFKMLIFRGVYVVSYGCFRK